MGFWLNQRYPRTTGSYLLSDSRYTDIRYLLFLDAWVAKHGEEPLLPGLHLSQKQLFWVRITLNNITHIYKKIIQNMVVVVIVEMCQCGRVVQVSAASAWCSKHKPEYLEHIMTTEEYSPSRFRLQVHISITVHF